MKNRAIIFDLDGTLLNSVADIAACANTVLEKNHLPTHSIERYKKEFIGFGSRQLFVLATRINDADVIDRLTEEFKAYYLNNSARYSSLYEGIEMMLNELENLAIKKSILSNKPHAITEKVVNHFFSHWDFETVLGHKDENKRKPDPGTTYEICNLMGIAPNQLLFVGDTKADILAAKAAGATSIGVAWGFRGKEELQHYKADIIIDSPAELLNLM